VRTNRRTGEARASRPAGQEKRATVGAGTTRRANPAGAVSTSVADDEATVAIVGPDTYLRTALDGPEFLVTPPKDRYWAVEVAVEPEFFGAIQRGAAVSAARFYATWQTGGLFPPTDATIFRLPPEQWENMWLNRTLYYRLVTSTEATRWANVVPSAPPGKIDLFGGFTKNFDDPIRPVEFLWRNEPAD
jgi:hypothetical protein